MASAAVSHNFEVRIVGTSGVQLDMLLVWNPTRGTPERLNERITVPYSKSFEGTGGWAWFDSLPEGGSGNTGDTYTVDWIVDGDVRAAAEGRVKPYGRQGSGVGRWSGGS